MPRFAALLPLIVVVACSPAEPEAASESWAAGRDGLCLTGGGAGLRAGLIVYGEGDANCSLTGSASREGDIIRITPTGDPQCSVEVALSGGGARIGQRIEACNYYCGPGADFSGRNLHRSDRPATSVTDLAGDPIC